GIGALELGLAGGPLWRILKMLRSRLEEIGHHWNILALAACRLGLGRRWFRIGRSRRPAIDRRLDQHIIIKTDRPLFAPLGVATAPPFGDRTPIGYGVLLRGGARLLVFRELWPALRGRLL